MIIIILILILFIIVIIIMIIKMIFVVAESTCLLAPTSVPFALRALTSAAFILTSSVRSFQFRWKCSFRAVWGIMIVMVVMGLAESTCLLAPVSVPPTVTASAVGPLVPATSGRLGHFFWKRSFRAERMIIMVVMVFAQSTCLLTSISIPSVTRRTTAAELIVATTGWCFIMIIITTIVLILPGHGNR